MTRATILLTAASMAACSTNVKGGAYRDGAAGSDNGGGQGTGGEGGGGQGNAAGTGGTTGAEPCPDPGSMRECTPEPCKKGTQTCVKSGGTASGGTWGPCQNIATVPGCPPKSGSPEPRPEPSPDAACNCSAPTTACETYCNARHPETFDAPCNCTTPNSAVCQEYCDTRDAGPPDGSPPGCDCVPSTVRWCDSPGACAWGKQTCTPDGKWGTCVEVDSRPSTCTTAPPFYGKWFDPCCCELSGDCCEGQRGNHGTTPWSVGRCKGIACGPDLIPGSCDNS